jgi:hypothetical protein
MQACAALINPAYDQRHGCRHQCMVAKHAEAVVVSSAHGGSAAHQTQGIARPRQQPD